jgi:hypothetical protein
MKIWDQYVLPRKFSGSPKSMRPSYHHAYSNSDGHWLSAAHFSRDDSDEMVRLAKGRIVYRIVVRPKVPL